jgi:hypothetical protein
MAMLVHLKWPKSSFQMTYSLRNSPEIAADLSEFCTLFYEFNAILNHGRPKNKQWMEMKEGTDQLALPYFLRCCMPNGLGNMLHTIIQQKNEINLKGMSLRSYMRLLEATFRQKFYKVWKLLHSSESMFLQAADSKEATQHRKDFRGRSYEKSHVDEPRPKPAFSSPTTDRHRTDKSRGRKSSYTAYDQKPRLDPSLRAIQEVYDLQEREHDSTQVTDVTFSGQPHDRSDRSTDSDDDIDDGTVDQVKRDFDDKISRYQTAILELSNQLYAMHALPGMGEQLCRASVYGDCKFGSQCRKSHDDGKLRAQARDQRHRQQNSNARLWGVHCRVVTG